MFIYKNVRLITIYGNNKALISLIYKPIVDRRTKYINVKYYYLRE